MAAAAEPLRIGLVSDTHLTEGMPSPPRLLEALRGCDLILHCGDLDVLAALDHLETVAPVLAVRGHLDPHEPGERLAERTRIVEAGGLRIGMVHDSLWPGPAIKFGTTLEFPEGDIHALLRSKFGEPVDVMCFGDTHEEYVGWYQGVLFVNPGSVPRPGPRHGRGELGTLAIISVQRTVAAVEIVKL